MLWPNGALTPTPTRRFSEGAHTPNADGTYRVWSGTLEVLVEPSELKLRIVPRIDLSANTFGFGRELFAGFRELAARADHGASAFGTV